MLKYLTFVPVALMLAQPVAAAVLDPYQAKGCRYEGEINAQNQPHGQGSWRCQDGRSYKGGFKNGEFSGKGVYTVAVRKETFLSPFNVNSTKLNNMVLSGTFKGNYADGRFKVDTVEGKPLFVMKFQKGMMQEVKLAKPNKK